MFLTIVGKTIIRADAMDVRCTVRAIIAHKLCVRRSNTPVGLGPANLLFCCICPSLFCRLFIVNKVVIITKTIVVSAAVYFVGAMAKRNEAMRSTKIQPTNVILESTRTERENHIADR